MMMSLGMFVFALDSVPYQQLQRQLAWRHNSISRVSAAPSVQYLGRDDETMTLSGVLLPEITGGETSLAALEEMAENGRAWPLIEGTGRNYGLFVITALSTTRTLFFSDGAARRIEFSLSLKRIDESRIDMLGTAGLT
ncbi:phage tail protein [Denitromonas sp.]|uniref:phage tail protein n=1 Tax=Denitromonas sp. TaxID=2734609 RepID=UPI003A8AF3FA